jgi:hypothetical protein
MKVLIVPLFVIFFTISGKAQTVVSKDTSCSFLKNLRFKHGVDTIVVKGTLSALVQLAPFTTYEENFLKRRRVNIHKIGSEIEFQPENCTKAVLAPLMVFADKERFINSDNNGISIYVTCVVFEGYLGYTNHSPYVLVIKVAPQKPIAPHSPAGLP